MNVISSMEEYEDMKDKLLIMALSLFVFICFSFLGGTLFQSAPHIFYFNVLVDDQGTVTEFQCFCYKEYYDRFEFTGSSGPGMVEKKDGRTVEIWEVRKED